MQKPVAVLYQATAPPARHGRRKPLKPGGYADSGADIAYALRQQQLPVVTPAAAPRPEMDTDWVFPDTTAGIQAAVDRGAAVLWLNTVLYAGHPVEAFLQRGLAVVGQPPAQVELYDDKWTTNELLRANQLPIPAAALIRREQARGYEVPFPFPVVAKPVLGRGSQGVTLVPDAAALARVLEALFAAQQYGEALYVEAFLPGQEVTLTVMPPGPYVLHGRAVQQNHYWSLPPVRRFNHHAGIAPYNGTVAVMHNSAVLPEVERRTPAMQLLCWQCEQAARLVGARAPIRIDCRANPAGQYFLFDLNLKPNMTGAARPHRADQDSLTALAARSIGWSFNELIYNLLQQQWQQPS